MGTKDNVKYDVSKGADRTSVATDGNGTVKAAGLTNETYNINLDGLKNDDGKTILDDTAVKNLLGGIDADDSTADKISRYTSVKQSGNLATDISYQGEKVYAYDLTKKSGNSDKTGSQITVTGKTEANHYDLLAAGNYDYTLRDGTHTLTIDRHDLNLDITAERQYGDISNQRVVSDYKNDAQPSGTLTVTNAAGNGDNKAYTMAGVAIQDADTASEDYAANVSEPATLKKSIGKDSKDSGYSHVIVDADGHILSYTLTALGTKIAGKDSTGTLARNYNLIWKPGGGSHQLDKVYTASNTASTIDDGGVLQVAKDTSKITVNNSSFKIDPLALTITVTGQRDYGETMDADNYVMGGTAADGHYKVEVGGNFADGESADTVLDKEHVESMLQSIENGADGKISKYTDVKRKAEDKSQIDSYNLNVGSTDTNWHLMSRQKTEIRSLPLSMPTARSMASMC